MLAEPFGLLPRLLRGRPLVQQGSHPRGGLGGVGEQLPRSFRRDVPHRQHAGRRAGLPEALVAGLRIRHEIGGGPELDRPLRDRLDLEHCTLGRRADRADGGQGELVDLLALVAEPPRLQLAAGDARARSRSSPGSNPGTPRPPAAPATSRSRASCARRARGRRLPCRSPCASVREVPSVSATANSRSERWMQRSAPSASARRSASSACGGPIVMATTSPPCSSRSRAACATAKASNGLSRSGTPSRLSDFVSSSNSIASGRGICLTRQTIFTRVRLSGHARRALRHPREPAGARAGARAGGRARRRPLAARRRLRHSEPVAARDARAPPGARERDLDPRQRRALAARPAARPARGDVVLRALRRRPARGRGRLALQPPAAGRARRRALRPRLAALRRRELRARAAGDEARMLDGVRDRTVVFGHSHQQFRRPGPDGTDLLNPGSVGMPLDGDTRSAWATYEDGDFTFRRTEYDVAAGRRRLPRDGRRLRRDGLEADRAAAPTSREKRRARSRRSP